MNPSLIKKSFIIYSIESDYNVYIYTITRSVHVTRRICDYGHITHWIPVPNCEGYQVLYTYPIIQEAIVELQRLNHCNCKLKTFEVLVKHFDSQNVLSNSEKK